MDMKFSLKQRVVVPGTDRTLQGIVASRTEFVDPTVQPLYRVRWLLDDLSVREIEFAQDVLIEAQGETPQVAKTESVKTLSLELDATAFRAMMDEELDKLNRKLKKKTKKIGRKKFKSKRKRNRKSKR